MIRPATDEDIPRLLGYAESFLSYHPMTNAFPHNLAAVEKTLRTLIASDDAALLVHDHGVIGGVINPMWCAPDVKVALEMFWWAESGGLALMRAFQEWAHGKGATIVQMSMIIGGKDVSAIYDRMGYMPVELSYVRAA